MKQSEFDKWDAETPAGKLPERVGDPVDKIRNDIKSKFGSK